MHILSQTPTSSAVMLIRGEGKGFFMVDKSINLGESFWLSRRVRTYYSDLGYPDHEVVTWTSDAAHVTLCSLHFWRSCWATRCRHSGSGRRCSTWRWPARKRPCGHAPNSTLISWPPCAHSWIIAWLQAGARMLPACQLPCCQEVLPSTFP